MTTLIYPNVSRIMILKFALDSCAISKQFLKLFSIWKNLLSLVVLARGRKAILGRRGKQGETFIRKALLSGMART